jgi:hypothetical protein
VPIWCRHSHLDESSIGHAGLTRCRTYTVWRPIILAVAKATSAWLLLLRSCNTPHTQLPSLLGAKQAALVASQQEQQLHVQIPGIHALLHGPYSQLLVWSVCSVAPLYGQLVGSIMWAQHADKK